MVIQKEHLCSYRDIPYQPSNSNTSHDQPCLLNCWSPHMIYVICGLIIESEINTLSTTFTWGLYKEIASLQQTPPGSRGLGYILWGWIYGRVLVTYRKRSLWHYVSELASKELSEHPWARPSWRWARVHVFCLPNPVSLWEHTHPSEGGHL